MKSALIVAGEASGDNHAAKLIREMKRLQPEISFFGIGGDKMTAEGVELIEHIDRMAVMGFIEVVKHIPFMKRLLRRLEREVEIRRTELAILVDYPGFNLRLAENLKEKSRKQISKIFYYISPQVWAWGADRIPKLAAVVDRMAGIIPFETEVYAGSGLDFHFVGHPLLDEMEEFCQRDEFFKKHELQPDKALIGLLPGSRTQEVARILPVMIEAAEIIRGEFACQFALGASPGVDNSLYKNLKNIKIIRDDARSLQKHSDLMITKSGTSTLETAIAGTPMIVVYKVNWLSYQIGRQVVKVKNIALANLVAGETVAPELIQAEANPQKIARTALDLLRNPAKMQVQRHKLAGIRAKLGEPGASRRAAELALELIY